MNSIQHNYQTKQEIRCWAIQNKTEMNIQIEHNAVLELLVPKSDYDFAGRSLYKQKREKYEIT